MTTEQQDQEMYEDMTLRVLRWLHLSNSEDEIDEELLTDEIAALVFSGNSEDLITCIVRLVVFNTQILKFFEIDNEEFEDKFLYPLSVFTLENP